MSSAGSMEKKLARFGQLVDHFVNATLKIQYPEVLYRASRHLFEAGGKRVRPFFVLESCVLVGGDLERTVPLAAAVELLHNFTLIHDDIMDNDDFRRNVPTVHKLYGTPIAIASGDLLFAKVYEAVCKWADESSPSQRKISLILRSLNDAAISICEGQALDISFASLKEVNEREYFRMIEGKTAALFKASAEIGALAGGGSKREIYSLGEYGLNAGLAFQLFDDYLGATADEKVLGKPVGSDLREGKKTLIIVHALDHASQEMRARLLRKVGNPDMSQEDLTEIQKALLSSGSLSYTLQRAQDHVHRAKESLKGLPDCEAKQDLLDIVDFFVTRKY